MKKLNGNVSGKWVLWWDVVFCRCVFLFKVCEILLIVMPAASIATNGREPKAIETSDGVDACNLLPAIGPYNLLLLSFWLLIKLSVLYPFDGGRSSPRYSTVAGDRAIDVDVVGDDTVGKAITHAS